MANWPGEERRRPRLGTAQWAVRAPLARWLEEQAREAGGAYRVLDVGCGAKPYYPFFGPRSSAYVGVDFASQPAADLVGSVEDLPVADASFDVVLCTQVLEHCDDPAQAVRELRRVTAPGGRVLVSTHGVQVYHPAPNDYWRWTAAGLERLFHRARRVGVGRRHAGNGNSDVARDAARDLRGDRPATHPPRPWCRRAAEPCWLGLDARFASLRELRPGSLTANLHLVARVGPGPSVGDRTPSTPSTRRSQA